MPATFPLSHQYNEESQEDDCENDEDDNIEENCSSSLPLLQSSSRGKRRRERERQPKPREMTEEEMMDLALRLSQQEASVAALKLQQEEEAVMKAIEESMVSQTQPCPSSQSQSLLSDAALVLSSRRKLLCTNGTANSQGVSADGCTSDTDVTRGDGNNHRGKKRKRKDGSPLLEMPDVSQAQKKESQASAFITDPLSVPLDTPQSSDSTQIDDYQLPKSPVFPPSPSLASRAEVYIPRLSQELLETCKTTGFVLCSQESWTSPHRSLPTQPKSPTFPKSQTNYRALSIRTVFPKSPVISETDQDEDEEMEQISEFRKSPVFAGNSQNESPPHGCKPKVRDCIPTCANSGFTFCSQESRTTSKSWQGRSPVFPQTHKLSNSPTFPDSPAFPEADHGKDGDTLQSLDHPASPVFGRTSQQHKFSHEVQNIAGPSATEHRDHPPCSCSGCNCSHQDTRGPPWCLRKGNKIDRSQDDGIVQSDVEEEPKQVSMDWKSSRAELTSNMTLHWSDEDDEGDCEVSPSPIFPKERATHHQPDSHSASTNHTAAAAGTARLNCSPNPRRCGRVTGAKEVQHPSTSAKGGNGLNKCFSFGPSSSSSSTLPSQQQQVPAPSATGQEARPDHSQGPVATPTVHYYWGVPFCPRGLEPDAYTQVILAQLEVYEKSLKQAQRCLLRKAEWGEAILPQPEKSPSPESPVGSPEQPPLRRRGLRLRGRKMRKSPSLEEDDKKDSEEEEHREKVNNEEEQGVEVDIDDCDVCPETQLSNDDDNTQDLTQGTDVTAEPKPQSPALPEIEFVLRKDGPHQGGSQEEVMEVDGPVDGRKEGDKSQNVRRDEEEGSRGAEVEEIEDKVLQKLISAELKASAAPQLSKPSIACPLCQGSFPLTEIEMHAAYCDGEVTIMEERRPEADCFQVSLKPRRKRSRKAEAAEETQDLSGLSNRANQRQEKCYVCHKAVLLRDYSRHTEECIPPRASNASNRGDLLSALEQTESREPEAGPSSGSKLQPRDVIDLRDEDEDGEGSPDMSAFRISRSPIRAFTPISEASDCLVDFKKQQQVKKPSRRPR
ncbi:uncharacterized protein uimc1 isoform X2 [Genypterus blacodes]|uniref:uncharacterized protein uimc1 isoform X2 n=1 Tax=Genypterus blacodes TaxID=154954 RepID=UPI003F769920